MSEWSGKGLPPVGTECEWSDAGRPYKRVLVMGHYGDSVWLRRVEDQTPLTVYANYDSFRPILSEEEQAIDEMAFRIREWAGRSLFDDEPLMLAEKLYNAGYRKQ